MDALSELGQQPEGAEAILLHPSHVIQDVASNALGRATSPDVTLAAVHALATLAGTTASLPILMLSIHTLLLQLPFCKPFCLLATPWVLMEMSLPVCLAAYMWTFIYQ